MSGNSSIVCDEESRWPVVLPSCIAVCPNPYSLVANSRLPESMTQFTEGSIAVIKCELGYVPRQPQYMLCQSNGTWGDNLPVCSPVTCPDLHSEHLQYEGENLHLSTIRLYCDTEYRLIGHSVLECQLNGKWSYPPPICEYIDCGPPPNLVHGSVQYSLTSLNAGVQYACNPGYTLNSTNSSVICSNTSTWLGEVPVCNPVTCDEEVIIPNGSIQPLLLTSVFGSYAHVVCDEGYRLRGARQVICSADGKWMAKVSIRKISS